MKVFNVFIAYLFHFMYVIILGIGGFIIEKDINTVLLISCLAFVLSIGVFIINFGITSSILIFIENEEYNLLAFLAPSIFMILLFKPINIFLEKLDFGADGFYWLIFFVSTMINVLSYFFIKRRN